MSKLPHKSLCFQIVSMESPEHLPFTSLYTVIYLSYIFGTSSLKELYFMDETYLHFQWKNRKYLIKKIFDTIQNPQVSKVGGLDRVYQLSTAKYFVSRQTCLLIERYNSEEFNKTQKFSISLRTSET